MAFPAHHGHSSLQKLQFVMERVADNDWCWAATAASVSRYYNRHSRWNQCKVATACFYLPCCHQPVPENCRRTYNLAGPLRRTGNLHYYLAGCRLRQDVQTEINRGRPICCHVRWRGGGGHFVAIVGYDASTDDVVVEDPLGISSIVPYAVFLNSYSVGKNQGGTWDFTYHTKA